MSDLTIANIDMVIGPFFNEQFDGNSIFIKDWEKVKYEIKELKAAMDKAGTFVKKYFDKRSSQSFLINKEAALDVPRLSKDLQGALRNQSHKFGMAFQGLYNSINAVKDLTSENRTALKTFGVKDEATFLELSQKINKAPLTFPECACIDRQLDLIQRLAQSRS